MKGYLKSIYYWAYYMETLFLSMLGVVLVIIAIYAFMDTEEVNWYRWMANYIPMLGIIFPISGGMNMANAQVPLVLSSGSTRKEAACGAVFMMHMVMMQFWILAVICDSFLPAMYKADGYLRMCGILLMVCCGMGNGLGAVILRFGSKWGMGIYVVVIVLFAGSIAIWAVQGSIDAVMTFISSTGVLVAGVIFDVVMAIAFYLGIRKYEVRI